MNNANFINESDAVRLQLEYVPIGRVVPNARNSRRHKKRKIRELATNIGETGG